MSDLAPQPEPVAEPPEENPGGVDAIDDTDSNPLPRDLQPEDNAATDESVPDEIEEKDGFKQQEPDDDADETQEGEPPA